LTVRSRARTGANDRAYMLAAQRGCEPARDKPVDNLHPFDMAGDRHQFQKHAVEGQRTPGLGEVGNPGLEYEMGARRPAIELLPRLKLWPAHSGS
jgi:hypothetical protein